MENEFGTVEYNGKTLWLAQQAYITNNPYDLQAVIFEAMAADEEGNEYMVRWLPRQDWLDACERLSLEQDDDPDEERLEELRAMRLPNAEDEENACNWDEPYTVVEY